MPATISGLKRINLHTILYNFAGIDNNGKLEYSNLRVPAKIKPYHLSITIEYTKGQKTLETRFRVYGKQECYYCGVNMIDTTTKVLDPNIDYLEFKAVGASQNFSIKIDKEKEKNPNACKYS